MSFWLIFPVFACTLRLGHSSWCPWRLSLCSKVQGSSACLAQFVRNCRCPAPDGLSSCSGPAVRNGSHLEAAESCQAPLCFERGFWCAWDSWSHDGPAPCGQTLSVRRSRKCCRFAKPHNPLPSLTPCVLATNSQWWEEKDLSSHPCNLATSRESVMSFAQVFVALVFLIFLIWIICCVIAGCKHWLRNDSNFSPNNFAIIETRPSDWERRDLPPSYSEAELTSLPTYETAISGLK